MSERPSCQHCKMPDSGMVMVHGECLCGRCAVDFDNFRKSEERKPFLAWKNEVKE